MGLITPLRQRLFLEDYGAARTRIPLTEVALNIIGHHPWLGIGLGNYTMAAPDYDTTPEGISYEFPRPVHNEFLLIAAEQGLPALGLFLVILLYIVIQLFRLSQSRTDPILPYLAIGLLGTLLCLECFPSHGLQLCPPGGPFLAAGRVVPGDGAGEPPGGSVTSRTVRGRPRNPLNSTIP